MNMKHGDALEVCSPLAGWCADLEDSPDPVFRGRLLGDGVSIDPTGDTVFAPCDGEVLMVPASGHALNLRTDAGAELLLHVGIDTVKLGGAGFRPLVAEGQRVSRGDPLLKFDLALLAREAPSLRTPLIVLKASGFEVCNRRKPGPVEPGDPVFRLVAATASEPVAGDPGVHKGEADHGGDGRYGAEDGIQDQTWASAELCTGLEHGLHARPAATFVEALSRFAVEARLRKGDGPWADAASPVELMGLGLKRGDAITLQVRGSDAESALEAGLALLEPVTPAADIGADQAVNPVTAGEDSPPARPASPRSGAALRGQVASPGLAQGPVVLWDQELPEPVASVPASGSPEDEWQALESARAALAAHLLRVAETEASKHPVVAEVARAHHGLLQDPGLSRSARQRIDAGQTAAAAWRFATEVASSALAELDDTRMRERVDDLNDLARQIQRILAGAEPGGSIALPEGGIVLADHLLPSELLALLASDPAGLALGAGGATSHVAILAAARGIPMLVGLGPVLLSIEATTIVSLDAERGMLRVDPSNDERERFAARISESAALQAAAERVADQPCHLADGTPVPVLANLASVEEAHTAREAGAEGCGLLRTEFLFMDRSVPPTREEQATRLQAIADALGPGPLVVRTLDAGADKPLDYLQQQPEENPALGVRGVRLSLEHPEAFEEQCEAILRIRRGAGAVNRADSGQGIDIMLPMVSDVVEVLEARRRLERAATRVKDLAPYRLGIMIETPAAALIADRLAPHVDFFSLGTNDLAQYTLSMDRLSPRLAPRLDVLHPAVLALIDRTCSAARRARIEVSVGGAAAADLEAAPVLIGLGVGKLSMPLGRIARMKAHLRRFSRQDCAALALQVMTLDSADAAREAVAAWLDERSALPAEITRFEENGSES